MPGLNISWPIKHLPNLLTNISYRLFISVEYKNCSELFILSIRLQILTPQLKGLSKPLYLSLHPQEIALLLTYISAFFFNILIDILEFLNLYSYIMRTVMNNYTHHRTQMFTSFKIKLYLYVCAYRVYGGAQAGIMYGCMHVRVYARM